MWKTLKKKREATLKIGYLCISKLKGEINYLPKNFKFYLPYSNHKYRFLNTIRLLQ